MLGCNFFDGNDNNPSEPGLQGGTPTETTTDLANDALQPPVGLELQAASEPGNLIFTWQTEGTFSHYSLFATHLATNENTTIASGLTETNRFVYDVDTLLLDWAHTSITLEACDEQNICQRSQPLNLRAFASASLQQMQTNEGTATDRFGQSTAIINNGQLLIITEPGASRAHLYTNYNQRQSFEQTLELNRTDDNLHVLRAALSSTGDTVVLASWSASHKLQLHIFDRLGPTWIETDTLNPVLPTSVVEGGLWQGSTLAVAMADDGNSIVLGLQGRDSMGELVDDVVLHISRIDFNWQAAVALPRTAGITRLPSLSASSDLSTVHLLGSAPSGELSLHHYTFGARGWTESTIQALPPIPATDDVRVQTSSEGNSAIVSAWEVSSTVGRSPVLWKLDCTDADCNNWIVNSSVRLPPTKNFDAELKFKSDGNQQTVLLGWQSSSEGVVSVLNRQDASWTETLPLPYFAQTLSGTRFVSDLGISRNGNAAVLTSITPITLTPSADGSHAIILE